MAIIGIIGGKGRMGNYFAEIFKTAGHQVIISDLGTKLTNEELASKADVVIVSVPIIQTASVIKKIVQRVGQNSCLVDLTSLKVFPVKEMLKAKCEVIGLHPMFGNTNPLSGQTIVACPVRSKKWFPILHKIFIQQGAKIEILTPKQHDQIMAIVQALVHFADIAFGHTLAKLHLQPANFLKFAGPASELKIAFVARLLAQDPELYGSIQMENPFAIKIIKQYLNSISELINITEKKDPIAFRKYFIEAGNGLGSYKTRGFQDTNFLIHTLLEMRTRKELNKKNQASLTRKADLAILGPKYTNSDLAAEQYINSQHQNNSSSHQSSKIYTSSISQIFEYVEKGQAERGIVPIENILQGSIRETMDQLFIRNVHISEKLELKIDYALVTLPGVNKKEIDNICSNEQAINQSINYLNKNFPKASHEYFASTIAALDKLIGSNDHNSAVVIPLQAAKFFNVQIIAKNIQDQSENKTSFAVIKKRPNESDRKNNKAPGQKKNYGTSIAFYFQKDKPGSLFSVFKDFAEAGINLTRIESRPSRLDLGNYIFYLDFIGHPANSDCKKVLQKIKRKAAGLKILGVYEV